MRVYSDRPQMKYFGVVTDSSLSKRHLSTLQ